MARRGGEKRFIFEEVVLKSLIFFRGGDSGKGKIKLGGIVTQFTRRSAV